MIQHNFSPPFGEGRERENISPPPDLRVRAEYRLFRRKRAGNEKNGSLHKNSGVFPRRCRGPPYPKAGAADGPEVIIERRIEKLAHERYTAETVIRVKGQLTEKQFRRLWLYCAKGMTQQQIAEVEMVGQRRVSTSIRAAMRRIKKNFSGGSQK